MSSMQRKATTFHSAPKKKAHHKNKTVVKSVTELAGNGQAGRTSDKHDSSESPIEADDASGAQNPDSPGNGFATRPQSPAHNRTTSGAQSHVDREQNQSDPAVKLEVIRKEREALRVEVKQLLRQLESIQEQHRHEVSQLRTNLEESTAAKENAEEQYQNLLGRVEKIKESLSDRLRRDKAELEEACERVEELEAQNKKLQESTQSLDKNVERLQEKLQDATRELTTLRSHNNLVAHNWLKEKDELTKTVQQLKEEMETTANAMGEWEVLAMEERSIKESLSDKVVELEEQVATLKQGYEGAATERDNLSKLLENLQNALREIQETRKRALREMVETTEAQLRDQKLLLQDAEARRAEAEKAKEELTKELERTAPFEKGIKEKNLLIGKLRHEAIVLNDHLTKALRYLKKTKPEDNVDRQVITNHLLHFLTLDRGDAKRFQILQVMAGYLNWTDEQREQAGLARPGASSGSLRLPLSPFHRTPSSPSLGAELFSEPSSAKDKESLAELWASFLERNANEAVGKTTSPASSSRNTMTVSASGLEPSGLEASCSEPSDSRAS